MNTEWNVAQPTIPMLAANRLQAMIQPRAKRVRIEDVPTDILTTIRVRMYALGALVWDYVDTVLILAKQMRREQTRRLIRKTDELRRDYESMRRASSDNAFMEREMEWAIDFEDYIKPHMDAMLEADRAEREAAFGKLEENTELLMTAVGQAMCMMKALRIYTKGCDLALKKYGVDMARRTLMPQQFAQLETLLLEFGGDTLNVCSTARSDAADTIALELTKIVVSDKDGDLELPEILTR